MSESQKRMDFDKVSAAKARKKEKLVKPRKEEVSQLADELQMLQSSD